jgi:hypothetical protein
MADARRQQFLEVLLARLEAITQANGFTTDAGEHVYLGFAPAVGPDDAPQAIAVIVGDDEPGYQGENVSYRLPIEVQAIAAVPAGQQDQPWLTVEAMLRDIKRAVEKPDRKFGGLLNVGRGLERGPTRTLPREAGSTAVGLSVTYFAPMSEAWGEP